jgi:DNA-binding protein
MAKTLSLSAMDKLLRKAGAERVSDKGKEALAEVLEDFSQIIGEKAVRFAKHSGRKTVKEEDIKLASKN